jgi:hypothetical protein
MKYFRVYADQNGDSHVEEREVELSLTDFAPPAPPVDLSSLMPATALAFLHAPARWDGPPHPAPRRQFILVLSGEIEGVTSDGEVWHFGPGNVILVEDTWGKGHATRVVGNDPVHMAIVQLPA